MSESGKGGRFLNLKPDEPIDVVMLHSLDEIQSVNQHDWWDINPAPHLVCLGDECPSCGLGNEARLKSYIAVVTKEQEVKYFKAGVSVVRQLEKYEKAVGDLTGRVMRFEKNGVGLKTKYSVLMLGKKIDVSKFAMPDLEELLGDLTVSGQIEILEKAGVDTSVLAKTAKKTKKASKVVEEPKEELDLSDDGGESESIDGWAAL